VRFHNLDQLSAGGPALKPGAYRFLHALSHGSADELKKRITGSSADSLMKAHIVEYKLIRIPKRSFHSIDRRAKLPDVRLRSPLGRQFGCVHFNRTAQIENLFGRDPARG
jgi:hypothetical protein